MWRATLITTTGLSRCGPIAARSRAPKCSTLRARRAARLPARLPAKVMPVHLAPDGQPESVTLINEYAQVAPLAKCMRGAWLASSCAPGCRCATLDYRGRTLCVGPSRPDASTSASTTVSKQPHARSCQRRCELPPPSLLFSSCALHAHLPGRKARRSGPPPSLCELPVVGRVCVAGALERRAARPPDRP